MPKSSRAPSGVQPQDEPETARIPGYATGGNEPQHVSIAAVDVLIHCARESFDAPTLRHLAERFGQLADEKGAGR